MSSHPNATADERAPLLAQQAAPYDADARAEPDDSSSVIAKDASRTWLYIWRISLGILAIIVLVVFIKGWIDADDVDVSVTGLICFPCPI